MKSSFNDGGKSMKKVFEIGVRKRKNSKSGIILVV